MFVFGGSIYAACSLPFGFTLVLIVGSVCLVCCLLITCDCCWLSWLRVWLFCCRFLIVGWLFPLMFFCNLFILLLIVLQLDYFLLVVFACLRFV